ncbi:MAG: DNA mismatch repair protein MutL, partial [Cyclobacteriaceae bacterium]
ERILFERYQKSIKGGSGASQSSLFPQQVSLNPTDHALVKEIQPEIRKLGFDIETSGKQMIVIQGVPSELAGCNEKEMFEELLEQFKQNKNQLGIGQQENICRALAKNAASLKCRNLPDQEADHLIDQLFACEQPNYTPGGRPTYVLVSLDKIKSWFNE